MFLGLKFRVEAKRGGELVEVEKKRGREDLKFGQRGAKAIIEERIEGEHTSGVREERWRKKKGGELESEINVGKTKMLGKR